MEFFWKCRIFDYVGAILLEPNIFRGDNCFSFFVLHWKSYRYIWEGYIKNCCWQENVRFLYKRRKKFTMISHPSSCRTSFDNDTVRSQRVGVSVKLFYHGVEPRHERGEGGETVGSSGPRRKRAIKGNNSGGVDIVPVAGADPVASRGTPTAGAMTSYVTRPTIINGETPSRCQNEPTNEFPCNFQCGWWNVVSIGVMFLSAFAFFFFFSSFFPSCFFFGRRFLVVLFEAL